METISLTLLQWFNESDKWQLFFYAKKRIFEDSTKSGRRPDSGHYLSPFLTDRFQKNVLEKELGEKSDYDKVPREENSLMLKIVKVVQRTLLVLPFGRIYGLALSLNSSSLKDVLYFLARPREARECSKWLHRYLYI